MFRRLVVTALLVTGPVCAHPADALDSARDAYAKGKALAEARDDDAAAYYFARAYVLSPSEVALREALKSALGADDAVLAARLVMDARAAKPMKQTEALVQKAEARFGTKTARVEITASCQHEDRIDSKPREALHGNWVLAGTHHVSVSAGGRTLERDLDAKPGELVSIDANELCQAPEDVPAAPPPPPKAAPAPREEPVVTHSDPVVPHDTLRGPSPTWFWIGVGATGVLAAVSTWSALDTRSRHERFVDSNELDDADAGRRAQTRTNVLFGVTGAVAVGTGVLGLFVVDWKSHDRKSSASVRVGSGVEVFGQF